MATFCKEGKRLPKASCSRPISCTSESCFQLEAQGHHQTDPLQISPACWQTPPAKNSPCPEWAGWRHQARDRQAQGTGSAWLLMATHLSGSLPSLAGIGERSSLSSEG